MLNPSKTVRCWNCRAFARLWCSFYLFFLNQLRSRWAHWFRANIRPASEGKRQVIRSTVKRKAENQTCPSIKGIFNQCLESSSSIVSAGQSCPNPRGLPLLLSSTGLLKVLLLVLYVSSARNLAAQRITTAGVLVVFLCFFLLVRSMVAGKPMKLTLSQVFNLGVWLQNSETFVLPKRVLWAVFFHCISGLLSHGYSLQGKEFRL